ncbi:EF-hand domain-containing protein [Saccharothrix algeriensis]|uniref:Ca2+-binding EF-hand superfamily protein n=1 Tax=Saccharothrix algeriensis TaxID=173560 RepID=A0A8T8HZ85_9PSEU|nr:EF-hand domain-containing protein [Saccharothrix algeriensis]MBM7809649.1 Ca2+-binding EF-hand superfamily protein [Saccharothrix algeriensis]QTR03953.1 EF-hand domain-containing protein [Saccharothrix algeriensis]
MTSVLKDHKFSIVFDWFDQGKDGRLTQDDFQATARMFAQVAREDDHATVTALHDAFDAWWGLVLEHGDTDGDGGVSREEFITVMQVNVTAPEHFDGAVMAIADAVINALDTDDDGVLSLDEYVRLFEALGIPREFAREAFAKLDRDGDGTVSHTEFRQAISDFYLSADPDAPGNYLLGPVSP